MRNTAITTVIVLLLIASCSKKTTPTASAPKAVNGATVFSQNCARCHGEQGIKDSRTPNLQTIPLDKAHLVNSITNGKNKMPAFKGKLSDADIKATIVYIRTLQKK